MEQYIYLDWNVFNKIEKISELGRDEKPQYELIHKLITSKQFLVPYSNAHISDLARGFLKNPSYTQNHIHTITELTGNLCLVQYWGEPRARWHYRSPQEFLDSTLEENDMTANSFAELLYMDDEPLINSLWDVQKSLLRMQKMDESFKEIYKLDPVFNIIFPRTKAEMNALAFCEDLFQFSARIKTDFVLYRNFQKFMIQLRLKLPQLQKSILKSQQNIVGKPRFLTWDEMVDKSTEQIPHKSKSAAYDKIVGLFTTTDLKGYSQDERFANMLDDALHTFYGAHCDYFITIDKRCIDKAKRVFDKLKISSQVMTPQEFANSFK